MHRFKVAFIFISITLPQIAVAFGCGSHLNFLLSSNVSKSRNKSNYHDDTIINSNNRFIFNPSNRIKLQLDSNKNSSEEELSELSDITLTAGVIAQPIVWVSLYYVATTGAGLPSGPFGLIGATEGISYLIIIAFFSNALFRSMWSKSHEYQGKSLDVVERFSCVSVIAGLLVLATLVLKQGCVPNAKPILDYSDYLPICDTTPRIFGV